MHRVGRTGRAGRKGTAITLFTEEDKPMLRSIANIMKISGCDIPEWMLQLKKINKNDRRRLAKHAVKREDITTQAKFDRKKKGNKYSSGGWIRDRKRGAKKGAKKSTDTPSIIFLVYLNYKLPFFGFKNIIPMGEHTAVFRSKGIKVLIFVNWFAMSTIKRKAALKVIVLGDSRL